MTEKEFKEYDTNDFKPTLLYYEEHTVISYTPYYYYGLVKITILVNCDLEELTVNVFNLSIKPIKEEGGNLKGLDIDTP